MKEIALFLFTFFCMSTFAAKSELPTTFWIEALDAGKWGVVIQKSGESWDHVHDNVTEDNPVVLIAPQTSQVHEHLKTLNRDLTYKCISNNAAYYPLVKPIRMFPRKKITDGVLDLFVIECSEPIPTNVTNEEIG